jgi:hypothetical protein
MDVVLRWVIGLFVSLGVGWLVTYQFVRWVRAHYRIEEHTGAAAFVPPWLTGLVERLFFTVLIAFNISGTAVAMIGWIAAKMAANWNRPGTPVAFAGAALSALLGGMMSMLFALLGGLICSGQIRLW